MKEKEARGYKLPPQGPRASQIEIVKDQIRYLHNKFHFNCRFFLAEKQKNASPKELKT